MHGPSNFYGPLDASNAERLGNPSSVHTPGAAATTALGTNSSWSALLAYKSSQGLRTPCLSARHGASKANTCIVGAQLQATVAMFSLHPSQLMKSVAG